MVITFQSNTLNNYKQLIEKILAEGEFRADRTGEGTYAIFGGRLEFDLRQHLPLVTLKKTLWRSAIIEMLWFLRAEPNTKFLHDHNVPIWDEWADAEGNLGPVYGVQWRKWPALKKPSFNVDDAYADEPVIDQIAELIKALKTNPAGRRHIVTAWNPTYLHKMGLPPCHRDFQCYVSNDGHLDLMWSQRSVDTMLGLPFNITQYAVLTHMLAMVTGLKPRYLSVNYGDAHIYANHIEKAKEMVAREVLPGTAKLIIKRQVDDIDSFTIDDFDVADYSSHAFMKLPVAV